MIFNNGLTIVIPTYNRKDRLIKQLSSLFRQKENLRDVKMIVADNHSDYNVQESLRAALSSDEFSMLEIITRPYNMGMSLGISMPFAYCKTRWLWILSDDDEVVGDISQVKNDLEEFKDYSLLKYNNITGQKQTESTLTGIYDFLDYYESPKHTAGDLLFLSNSIFNVEELFPYISNAFVWAGTLYGHIIPLLFGLSTDSKSIKCKMRDYDLVKYLSPDKPNSMTSILRNTLGFSMIDDIVFPGEDKDKFLHRRICRIIQYGTGFSYIAYSILKTYHKREARNKFYRIYNAFYDYGLKNRIIRGLFDLSQITNINFFSLLKKYT